MKSVLKNVIRPVIGKSFGQSWSSVIPWTGIAPSSLVMTIIDDTEVKLDWNLNTTDEDETHIFQSTNNIDFTDVANVGSGVETKNITGLNPQTIYYFYVKAKKGSQYTSPSGIANGTTTSSGLFDGHTLAWYQTDDLTTVDIGATGLVEEWRSKLNTGIDLRGLTENDSFRPIWRGQGIRFNGATNILRTKSRLALTRPTFYYLVFERYDNSPGNVLLFGYDDLQEGTFFRCMEDGVNVGFYQGSWVTEVMPTLGVQHIARVLANGASSKVIIDENAPVNGNFSTAFSAAWGCIGGSHLSSGISSLSLRELIIRDSVNSEAEIFTYLKNKYTALYNYCIIGDSNWSQYSAGWWPTRTFLTGVYNFNDNSYQGDTISQQKTRFLADDQSNTDIVSIMIGANDVNIPHSAATIIADLQDLINTVRANIKAGGKIILLTMTPLRTPMGETKYGYWLAVNAAIRGEGATPITGADKVINEHLVEFEDPANVGNFKAGYQISDYLHANNLARKYMAQQVNIKLLELGY